MSKKHHSTINYILILLGAILIYFVGTKVAITAIPISLLLYLTLFFSVAETVSIQAGIFSISTIIILETIGAFYPTENNLRAHLTETLVITLFAGYYFLIKNVRKRKLRKTSKQAKHFRSLANYSLQPLILKNEHGEIIFASNSIKNLLGLETNLTNGSTIEHLLYPEDTLIYKQFFESVLSTPNEKKSIDIRMKKGTDGWIWVRKDSINLLKNKDIKAIVSTVQDITFQKELDREKANIISEEKKARSLAENALRERDEFLSIASHELKTPLTTVLLQLQSTLRKILTQSLADFSGAELLNSLQIAEKQSQRLGSLIKDLLNVSIASTGRISLNKEPVNLSELVASLIKRFDQEIKLSEGLD